MSPLALWVKMQFEMLLDVYLARQLLRRQAVGLLEQQGRSLRLGGGAGGQVEAGGAHGVGQILGARHLRRIRRERGVGRGVVQAGAEGGSRRKCNDWGATNEEVNRKRVEECELCLRQSPMCRISCNFSCEKVATTIQCFTSL